MPMISRSLAHAVAVVTVLGTLAAVSPAFAAPLDNTSPAGGPPNSTVNLDNSGHVVSTTPDTASGVPSSPSPMASQHEMNKHSGMIMKHHSPEEMREHVEERIKNLHAKLGITQDQEKEWSDVAQAMRDSEANVATQIQARHRTNVSMSAVDDLESYQSVAQAHADGLKNVITAFKTLYGNMSDAQKKNADKVFGTFEGHRDRGMKKHS